MLTTFPPIDRHHQKKHVLDLYQDIGHVIDHPELGTEYFLGTIVVIDDNGRSFVVDGQQRLATSMMLIAAIRDYLLANNNGSRAEAIQTNYMLSMDEQTDKLIPHLHLNDGDQTYFYRRVLLKEAADERKSVTPNRPSHDLINIAAKLAREHIYAVVNKYQTQYRADHLLKWIKVSRRGRAGYLGDCA